MESLTLGKTGLSVSVVALGTVSLGVDYGIAAPGGYGRPASGDAERLLHEAAAAGINFFDTAPAYGEGERLLGSTLAQNKKCLFATKVSAPVNEKGPLTGQALRKPVRKSVEDSLRALKREVIDILQIHNATTDLIARGEMTEELVSIKAEGKARFLGASVYTEDEAMAVIHDGRFDVLQVPFNILDQKMAKNVFPAAKKKGIGVVVRSVYLKGALTKKAEFLPPALKALRDAVLAVRKMFDVSWEQLPQVALRFCLSVASGPVLLGPRTAGELHVALAALESGPFARSILDKAQRLSLENENLVNPALWPDVQG